MNISDFVLVVVSVVVVISLFLNFIMFNHITNMNIFVNQLHTGLSNMLNRTVMMEQILGKVGSTLEELVVAAENLIDNLGPTGGGKMGSLYRTMDGKYSAETLEELVEKIKENQEEEKYFKDEDMDKLRKLFEEDDEGEEDEDLF